MKSRICRMCYDEFIPVESWELFCCHMCRVASWVEKGHVAREEVCTYCGAPADTVDHIPATVTYEKMLATGIAAFSQYVVPACRDCNCFILNDLPLWTLRERLMHVAEQIPIRHGHILALPKWKQREIDELGPNMKQYVLAGMHNVTVIKNRIAYAEAQVKYYDLTDVVFVPAPLPPAQPIQAKKLSQN